MKIAEFALGYRSFNDKDAIINFISNSKYYNEKDESPTESDALLIFKTSKQQTWLVASAKRLYIILDDIRKDQPNINRSFSKNHLIDNNHKVSASIEEKQKSDKTGVLMIEGMKKGYLFSRMLFSYESIIKKVTGLLMNQMAK